MKSYWIKLSSIVLLVVALLALDVACSKTATSTTPLPTTSTTPSTTSSAPPPTTTTTLPVTTTTLPPPTTTTVHPPTTILSGSATVLAQGFTFNPQMLTVTVGTTVTWINKDGEDHTVTSDTAGLFDAVISANGGTFSYRFDKAGTYDYSCLFHSGMVGTILVK